MGQHLSAALSLVNSAALRHGFSAALCNSGMRPVEDVRRARLLELKARFGSWAALNVVLGNTRSDSTLSQIASESEGSKTKKPKTMGSPLARKIESLCSLPVGWMDTDPELSGAAWPFPGVNQADVMALNAEQLALLQNTMNAALGMALSGGGSTHQPNGAPARRSAA